MLLGDLGPEVEKGAAAQAWLGPLPLPPPPPPLEVLPGGQQERVRVLGQGQVGLGEFEPVLAAVLAQWTRLPQPLEVGAAAVEIARFAARVRLRPRRLAALLLPVEPVQRVL